MKKPHAQSNGNGSEADRTEVAIVKEDPAPSDGGTATGSTVITIDDMVVEPAGGTGDAVVVHGSDNIASEDKILDTSAESAAVIHTMSPLTADPPKPPRPKAPYPQIGDRVWRDFNGNGMQEAGEPESHRYAATVSGSAS